MQYECRSQNAFCAQYWGAGSDQICSLPYFSSYHTVTCTVGRGQHLHIKRIIMKRRLLIILPSLLLLSAKSHSAGQPSCIDYGISRQFRENNKRFIEEVASHGDYDTWATKNQSALGALKKYLNSLPDRQRAFRGKEDWHFLRKSSEHICAGDISIDKQAAGMFSLLKDYREYLARMPGYLFACVPVGEERNHCRSIPLTARIKYLTTSDS